jgi:hypothetical protein
MEKKLAARWRRSPFIVTDDIAGKPTAMGGGMGRGAAHGGREIGMGSSRRPDPASVEAGSGVE